jgi:hypothetical protein
MNVPPTIAASLPSHAPDSIMPRPVPGSWQRYGNGCYHHFLVDKWKFER